MQDFIIDVLSPRGAMAGKVALRVFNTNFPSTSAVCQGFVFDPALPRISMMSGAQETGIKSLRVPMSEPSDISIEIENAPIDVPTSSVSIVIGCSTMNIALVTRNDDQMVLRIISKRNSRNSPSIVHGLVIFGSAAGICSKCCEDDSCPSVYEDVKTACFSFQYYDDQQPFITFKSDSNGPDVGGQTLSLQISNLPIVTQGSSLSVACGSNNNPLGEVVVLLSDQKATEIVVITSAMDLNGASQKRLGCYIEHSERPDKTASFAYVYYASKTAIVSVSPVSGCSSHEHEVFVSLDFFPYPSSARVAIGTVVLSADKVRIWPSSNKLNTFISFTLPPLPPRIHLVTVTPSFCSAPCAKEVKFSFGSIDCSWPRIRGATSVNGPTCADHLPEIQITNFPPVPVITHVSFLNMDQMLVKNITLNITDDVEYEDDFARLVIPNPAFASTSANNYTVRIETIHRGQKRNVSFNFYGYDCFNPRVVAVSPSQIPVSTTACGKRIPLHSTVSILIANALDVTLDNVRAFVGISAERAKLLGVTNLADCKNDAVDCLRTRVDLEFPAFDSPGVFEVSMYLGVVSQTPSTFQIEYVVACDLEEYCQSISMIPNSKMLLDFPSFQCELKYCIESSKISDPKIISLTPSEGTTAGGTYIVLQVENFPVFEASDLVVEVGAGASKVFAEISGIVQEQWSNLEKSRGEIHIRSPAVARNTESMTFYLKIRVCSMTKFLSFDFEYLPIVSGPAIVLKFQPAEIYACQQLNLIVQLQNVGRFSEPFNNSLMQTQVGDAHHRSVDQIISSDRFSTIVIIKAEASWQSSGTLQVKVYSLLSGQEENAASLSINVLPEPDPSIVSIYPTFGKSHKSNVIQVTIAHASLSIQMNTFASRMIVTPPGAGTISHYNLSAVGFRNLTSKSCVCAHCLLFELKLESKPLDDRDQLTGGIATVSIYPTIYPTLSFKYTFQAAGNPSLDFMVPKRQKLFCEQGYKPIKFFLLNFPSQKCKDRSTCAQESEWGGLQVQFGQGVGRIQRFEDANGLLLVEAFSPATGVAGLSEGRITALDLDGNSKSVSFRVFF